ncbi:MAG: TFIIB-type zinc ribbon-containing protein [Thermodesulfovibrionales bacterium]
MDLIACEHCGKMVNPRSMYCPFCGGRAQTGQVISSPLCPRCGTALECQKKNEIEIDVCPGCKGLWLDRGEFNIVTAESTVYREEKLSAEYSRPAQTEKVEYIPCARCGKLMIRKNFGKISGVIIDECASHGVWLDSGELEKIRHFILDGGLEKEQFREIEKNRQELREVAQQVDDLAFSHKLIHYWNWKRWFF